MAMTEKRWIDANALLELYDMGAELEDYAGTLSVPVPIIRQNIRDMPTADAVEVVHSWWEKSAEGYKMCHHCKADIAIFSGHKNFCPNCGADMRGESDG